MNTNADYEILHHWSRLEWLFPEESSAEDFDEQELWKGAMAAGFKIDRDGNHYLSVPR